MFELCRQLQHIFLGLTLVNTFNFHRIIKHIRSKTWKNALVEKRQMSKMEKVKSLRMGPNWKCKLNYAKPFLQGQFFGTNLKLIFRRGKIFSCRRNDIFGRYFGMILLYFRTKICLMIGKQTSYWSKTGFFSQVAS